MTVSEHLLQLEPSVCKQDEDETCASFYISVQLANDSCLGTCNTVLYQVYIFSSLHILSWPEWDIFNTLIAGRECP